MFKEGKSEYERKRHKAASHVTIDLLARTIYFTKLFQKYQSLTPKEFRDAQLNEGKTDIANAKILLYQMSSSCIDKLKSEIAVIQRKHGLFVAIEEFQNAVRLDDNKIISALSKYDELKQQ